MKGDLKNNPSIRKLAEMPDDLYELLEKTDPLRVQIVRDCRAIVSGE